MFKISVLISCFLILLAGIWLFLDKNKIEEDKKFSKDQKIVAFGDSLVRGYGSTEGNDFVSLTSKNIGIPIKNLGRNGDTTESALNRIEEVLREEPDIAIILLGGNDYLRKIPQSETENNLRKIIKTFKDKNIKVLLLGIKGGVFQDPFVPMFEKLSEGLNVPLVPNVLKGIFGKNDLMFDLIHPNNAGYRIISDKVNPVLKEALK